MVQHASNKIVLEIADKKEKIIEELKRGIILWASIGYNLEKD